jgi:hypothetical protein
VAEAPEEFSGELDMTTLPKFDDAEILFEGDTSVIYVSAADIETVAAFSRANLAEMGWELVTQPGTDVLDTPDLKQYTFRKDGQGLSVFITVAPAQDNKTSVQYSPTLLVGDEVALAEGDEIVEVTQPAGGDEPVASGASMPDIPVPTEAKDVTYDADFGELTFSSPLEIKKLVDYYRKELKSKDWIEEEIVAVAEDTFGSLQFNKEEASLSLTFFRIGEATDVTISMDGLSGLEQVSGDDSGSGSTAGSEDAGSDEPLVAEDKDGLPIPNNYGNYSSEGSQFSRTVITTVPADLTKVLEFYRQELPAQGWAEQTENSTVEAQRAALVFRGDKGVLSLKLNQSGAETEITLALKDEATAKKAGILPPAGQSRLYFGNINEAPITYILNQKEVKVDPQDPSQQSMEGVPYLDLPPGKYEYTLTIPGEPAATDSIEVGVDESWGLIGGPGGAFPVQLY